MYNLLSLLSRDTNGNVFSKEKSNPEIERIRESVSEFFKENKISVKLIMRKNSLFFDDTEKMNRAIKRLFYSGSFFDLFNMNDVDLFEKQIEDAETFDDIMKLFKKTDIITVSVFLFPSAIYSLIQKEFKGHEKLFYNAILPERENFFLRIARNGLKDNFANIFRKREIRRQEIVKDAKLNDCSYWHFNFINDNVKKNIHALNTLQYLLDEKNNYVAILTRKAHHKSDEFGVPNTNKLFHHKKYLIFNQESRFAFIDKMLYYYLKTNKKIYSYQLSHKRLYEFERLYNLGLLSKNGKSLEYLSSDSNCAKNSYKPQLIVLNLTSRCNFRCPYCYNFNNVLNEKQGYLLNYDRLMKSVMNVVKNVKSNHFHIVFHGGEPLIHLHEILKMIQYFKIYSKENNTNFAFSVQTNGYFLNLKNIKVLRKHDVRISVSIDGDILTNLSSRGLTFSQASQLHQNLIQLKNLNQQYSILCTVNKKNYSDPISLLKYYDSIGVSSVRFNTLIYSSKYESELISVEDYTSFFLKVFDEYLKNNYSFRLANLDEWIEKIAVTEPSRRSFICSQFPCGAGLRMLNILGNGDIYPCGELALIDELRIKHDELNENNLFDLINSRYRILVKSTIADVSECKLCVLKNICTDGCVGRIYHSKNNFMGRSDFCYMFKKIIFYLLDNINNPKIQRIFSEIKNKKDLVYV